MVKVLRSWVRGPLEPFIVDFAEELAGQGYSRTSTEQHVCFIAHLDRWLSASGLDLAQLTEPVLERYLAQRRAAGYANYRSMKALQPLLDYLRPLEVLSSPVEVPTGPVEQLLKDYGNYLLAERGLTQGTVQGYVHCVRPFLTTRIRGSGLDLAGLTAADVTGYVLVSCRGRATGSAKLVVCALRSLLRWLHLCGQVPACLTTAVPSVAGWRLSGLPQGLSAEQLRRLLASCDRRTATGRRDYAILLLLSRLGLRAGEVARLGLGDIDWRHGELAVVGKGNRAERLPLPADAGAAITAYLRRGRPATAQDRTVFVRVHAPHRRLTGAGISEVVEDAGHRAALGTVHAHRLRHTAATAMLRAGASLPEVGQVLRHRSAWTTATYAKVDRDALRVLARPWPLEHSGDPS